MSLWHLASCDFAAVHDQVQSKHGLYFASTKYYICFPLLCIMHSIEVAHVVLQWAGEDLEGRPESKLNLTTHVAVITSNHARVDKIR